MKETSATSKKLHQLSTPIKVNFDVCPKISRHDGLQIFYNISFGWHRFQGFPERGQSNRNFLLTPINFLRTINLMFLKQQDYYYPNSKLSSGIFKAIYQNVHLNSGAQNRKCAFLYADIFSGRLYFLNLTLSKVNFQEKAKVTSVTNSIQSKF